jgi:hypothetical protein
LFFDFASDLPACCSLILCWPDNSLFSFWAWVKCHFLEPSPGPFTSGMDALLLYICSTWYSPVRSGRWSLPLGYFHKGSNYFFLLPVELYQVNA